MNYPNNSMAAMQQKEQKEKTPIAPVIQEGSAVIKKKSGFRKLIEVFIAEDLVSAKHKLVNDLIVPTIKNGIVDCVSLLVKGERTAKSSVVTSAFWGKAPQTQTYNYNAQFANPMANQQVRPITVMPYDEIEYLSMQAAKDVLDRISNLAYQYGRVSILDLYNASGMSPQGNYTYDDYGWQAADIMHARITSTFNGHYIINLPKPQSLR